MMRSGRTSPRRVKAFVAFGVRGSTFNLFEIDRSTDLGTRLGELASTSQTFLRIRPCSSIAVSHYHCQTTVYLGGCNLPEGPS
jgi:hypothetical protein